MHAYAVGGNNIEGIPSSEIIVLVIIIIISLSYLRKVRLKWVGIKIRNIFIWTGSFLRENSISHVSHPSGSFIHWMKLQNPQPTFPSRILLFEGTWGRLCSVFSVCGHKSQFYFITTIICMRVCIKHNCMLMMMATVMMRKTLLNALLYVTQH